MLFIIYTCLLSRLVMSQKPPCCQSKVVGMVNYYLVDYKDTSEWGCKDNCVHYTEGGPGLLQAWTTDSDLSG